MAGIVKYLKKTVLFFIPKTIRYQIELEYRKRLFSIYQNLSFSQEGEDLILGRFFEGKNKGFYIDVGAHHPMRFSNTYKFYLNGWRGINIDAMPDSMDAFRETRPDDINLEIPISETEQLLTYYIFNEKALNTFSEEEAKRKDNLDHYKIVDKKLLKTRRLEEVLDEYLPINTHIDFLSVDVEGLDFEVLRSNNWGKYRPDFILVEDLLSDLEKTFSSDLYIFMKSRNYRLVARTYNTLIFKLVNSYFI